MERFTVKLSIHSDDKSEDFTHKFEQMRDAKLFALRAIQLKENKHSSIEIFDNRANQRVYYHHQVNGMFIYSNLK